MVLRERGTTTRALDCRTNDARDHAQRNSQDETYLIDGKRGDPNFRNFTAPVYIYTFTEGDTSEEADFEAALEPFHNPDGRWTANNAEMPSVSYKMATVGNCAATGDWIVSKAGCEAAASSLGLPDDTASDNTHADNPYGCYYKKSTQLLYWSLSGNKNDGDADRVSICSTTGKCVRE